MTSNNADKCSSNQHPLHDGTTTPTISSTSQTIELFVPGRICLFGEHSDWAGGYRRADPTIPVGKCLLSGTNQGLHARVSKNNSNPNKLVLRASLNHQMNKNNKTTVTTSLGDEHVQDSDIDDENLKDIIEIEISMDDTELLRHATSDSSIWSYICGVTYQLKKAFPNHNNNNNNNNNDSNSPSIHGIILDNYKTTLPVKKGLSSSAAICVLTVRAFNELFQLNLSTREEMEYAFLGETTTPSQCGRMDQGCAYGVKPILMTFDGDDLDVDEAVPIGGPIHLILVDLHASKNTPAILRDLQKAYPGASCPTTQGVQALLGPINHVIMDDALAALRLGCAKSVGAIMCRAQEAFDTYAIPASPDHLTSPVLHAVLAHERLQPHIHGGKGVGSQGDGSAQFVVKSLEDQRAAIEIIEEDFGMTCLSLTLGLES